MITQGVNAKMGKQMSVATGFGIVGAIIASIAAYRYFKGGGVVLGGYELPGFGGGSEMSPAPGSAGEGQEIGTPENPLTLQQIPDNWGDTCGVPLSSLYEDYNVGETTGWTEDQYIAQMALMRSPDRPSERDMTWQQRFAFNVEDTPEVSKAQTAFVAQVYELGGSYATSPGYEYPGQTLVPPADFPLSPSGKPWTGRWLNEAEKAGLFSSATPTGGAGNTKAVKSQVKEKSTTTAAERAAAIFGKVIP